jgi:hypothetical protein
MQGTMGSVSILARNSAYFRVPRVVPKAYFQWLPVASQTIPTGDRRGQIMAYGNAGSAIVSTV